MKVQINHYHGTSSYTINTVLVVNNVHPDQLTSWKPADQDPHCFPLFKCVLITVIYAELIRYNLSIMVSLYKPIWPCKQGHFLRQGHNFNW